MRTQRIERLDDPRVSDYRNVRDADLRRAANRFVAEGRLNVKRLLDGSRYRARSVFVTPTALAALRPELERRGDGVPVYVAEAALLKEVVGYDMHRGCLAVGERGAPLALEEVLAEAREGPQLWIALEQTANPDNVGGILRNALAFGADALLLGGGCVDPLGRKSIRVSMGAALKVPCVVTDDWLAALRRLQSCAFQRVALGTSRDAVRLERFAPAAGAKGVVLLLGAEGPGLSAAALREADGVVTIPMMPGIDSLNVATASGIALHHVARAIGRLAGDAACAVS